MTVDSRFIAAIDLIGLTLSVIGGLYLAYDLLGSKHGSLRIMTRALTYGLLFAITYTLFLGLTFGIVAAIGMGSILGVELIRMSPGDQHQRSNPYVFAALRGTVVEWRVNNLTEREMGAIGIFLILIGFILQSLESWLKLFSVRII